MFYREKSQTSRIQNREFKVKFTGNEGHETETPNKEMILGGRTRTLKEFLTMTSRIAIKSKDLDSESDSQACISKRELHINHNPKEKVEYQNINSSVIVNSFDSLSGFFDHQVAFKLIFRASNHNFRVADFHQICDSYQNTLTLCLTEDFKIIGGFTPLTWEEQFEQNVTHFKSDLKKETFLFSVTDKAKYPLVRALKNKAICCFKSYGPTFGGGYDLLIGDRTNEIANTTSYFPRNFEHPKGINFNKRDFTGTSRKNFKLQQWEVYSVIRVQTLHTMEGVNFATQPSAAQEIKGNQTWFERLKACAKQAYSKFCKDA